MGCDAIHPGYGFLSENAEFARICEQKGVTFIGPKTDVIHKMGDKTQARDTMRAAGVPITPGSEGNLSGLDEAIQLASEIGYPIMIKATSGGAKKNAKKAINKKKTKKGKTITYEFQTKVSQRGKK